MTREELERHALALATELEIQLNFKFKAHGNLTVGEALKLKTAIDTKSRAVLLVYKERIKL